MWGGLEIILNEKPYFFFVKSSQRLIVLFFKRLTPLRQMLNFGNPKRCFSCVDSRVMWLISLIAVRVTGLWFALRFSLNVYGFNNVVWNRQLLQEITNHTFEWKHKFLTEVIVAGDFSITPDEWQDCFSPQRIPPIDGDFKNITEADVAIAELD